MLEAESLSDPVLQDVVKPEHRLVLAQDGMLGSEQVEDAEDAVSEN